MVAAPPSSIGKFGADTDNWMWPRHTGDFSIFRVYADSMGNPAPYSEKNIPLRPKKYFNLSTQGIQENDFVMLMGFPYVMENGVPCFVRHMTEEIFFLYLCGKDSL